MSVLHLDVSLWSADLANLQAEIARLEPYADSFHFDAADGHMVPALLFFPDLIVRLRELTKVEFHLHLMATRPLDLIDAFLDAGVERVTLPVEAGKRVRPALEHVKYRFRKAGVSVALDTPVEAVTDYLGLVDRVVMMGTELGVKGLSADARAYDRIRAMKELVPADVMVVADGGIREESVPALRKAGADGIVPGSLVCKAEDIEARVNWLKGL